jgi:dephospho-CoA kinase
MRVIGVVGGIASGKSRVCEQFASLGAIVIAADPLGHEALRDPAVRRSLVERWGAEILQADGEVDRAAVARRVFSRSTDAESTAIAKAELRFLEGVVHPWIESRFRERLEAVRAAEPDAVVLLDAALLLEAGWDRWCDGVLFVDSAVERRRERALQRGWTVEQWRSRENAQWPVEKKREVSRWTIDNSGSSADTYGQVETLWRRLREEV